MNSDEKEAVTEIVCKKNNLDIDNRIIDEVTLEGGVPKQTTIEINFNTGEIKKEVICEKSNDVIENKRVRVNPADENRAEVNTVFDNEMTNNITECRKARKPMKPLVDKKEEIYKILEDSDDEDNSSNHSEKLSKTNEMETEEAVISSNIRTIPGNQNLLDTEHMYNDKTIETGKQFHSSDEKKTVEVSTSEKVHSFVLPLQYEQFRTDVSENGRIHNKSNEPSSPSLIKPKRQFKCDQCPVSYSW